MDQLPERLARLSPQQVARLLARLGEKGGGAAPGIPRRPPDEPCPLSFSQQRLWFVDRLEPGSIAYNALSVARFEGALEVEALRAAVDGVVARHEALRTVFAERGGEAEQVVLPALRVPFEVVDLGALGAAEAGEEVGRRARHEARRPFDLAAGPLLRAVLLRVAADRHHLVLTMHHIAADGWSRGIVVRELAESYAARVRGEEPRLPPPPIQFPDYAAWQRGRLRGALLREQLDWWTERLRGAPPVLELPADRPRPPVQSVEGALHRFAVPAAAADALRGLAREEEATSFMVLLAAYLVFLARYTGATELVVGTPAANRGQAETEGAVGFFANTLALRADLGGDPGFREALRRVREVALGAYAHEELPFERLVEELRPERDPGRSVLFQTLFVLDGAPPRPLRLPGVEMTPVEAHPGTSPFDLTLRMEEGEAGLAGALEYATALFDAATAARMAEHFATLLEGIAARPEARISDLPLMTAAERRRVLAAWNDTERGYPAGDCVHDLFARQAARTPDAPALVFRGERLSYAGLERRANRLANALRARGVGPEARVGVCLERTPELVVALLAVLKAGGAYVPLDPAYPAERLGYMVEDAAARLVLTDSALAGRLPPGAEALLLDEPAAWAAGDAAPESGVGPENLSHVIFTSGSTGRPRGVMIRHSSTVVLLRWLREVVSDEERSSVLFATSVNFDVSVAELFGTLAWGGKLVLVENALELAGVEEPVTLASMVPSAAAELLRSGGIPPSVKTLNLGGEALPDDLARALHAPGTLERVGNLYGPTEDTTYSTYARVERGARVSIGRPVANTRAYVLDDRMQPVPVGVAGELYLAGDGLARGYAARPDLTAERFLPDPFGPAGTRMYRVMDRVRRRADGELEYRGRTDFQVKVRGFRIEPGEIEAALRALPGVGEAVAVVREDAPGERRIVAYLAAAPDAAPPPAAELRARLRERVPEYMVPSAFVVLPALPLTPNGKLDRRALPAPDAPAGGEWIAPRTPTEAALAEIWAAALGAERVGAGDGFFELGGHSLLGTRVVSRVRDELGVDVPLRALFEAPVLADFARRVDALRAAGGGAPRPDGPRPRGPSAGDRFPLSPAQRRLWFIDQLEPGSAAYAMPAALRVRGPLRVDALRRALGTLAARHESLRTVFARAEDGEPVQVVRAPGAAALPVADLRALAPAEREAELRRLAAGEARRPFDLARGPLLRASLVRLDAAEWAILFTMHHIVSDGWSMAVLVREVSEAYGAIAAGREPSLPPLPVQYADYALWQRESLSGERLEAQLAWWRRELAGAPPLLELPTDRPRPAAASGRAGHRRFELPAGTAGALRALARGESATLFMALLAGFHAVLSRWSGQEDVSVGTPAAGRDRSELEGLIGFFVNTLVIRGDLSGDPSFRELLARVRAAALGAFSHQELPFERLVEELQPERAPGHTPLFQVVFSLRDAGDERLRLGGLATERLELDAGTARFDLSLAAHRDGERLGGMLVFRADLLDGDTAGRLLDHYVRLLDGAAAHPDRPVAELELLTADERARLLAHGTGAARAFPAERCVHELVREQAARTPGAIAVAADGERLTYAELEARAEALAARLRAAGVRPDDRVGLLVERGADAVVGVLGILRAGGAYLPLDPGSPDERLLFMLEDSGAEVLVTHAPLAGRPAGFGGARVDAACGGAEPPVLPAESVHSPSPRNLAYVVYTSGSTGAPKGVLVEHRGLVNYLSWFGGEVLGGEALDLPLVSRLAFDAHVRQLFPPLLRGGAVWVLPEAVAGDPRALLEAISARERVGFGGVPSLWSAMLELVRSGEAPRPAGLRAVLLGGEALGPELAERTRATFPDAAVWNHYGPTEATVNTTVARVRGGGRVGIGRPVANVRVRLLDRAGSPVPVGVPGELYVGGPGVARGYLGRPELTAERFVPDPWADEPGARMYRSGDRARWRPDGELDYVGRTDFQLKLRGFRIEPGEVEAVLERHPAVREAVVVARGGRLVGYLVARGGAGPSPAELRAWLGERLPEHMVPAALVVLETLPLTVNGKVDRRALPEPEEDGGFVAPRTPAEEILAGIYETVLGAGRVGAGDDFFALGGHSLLAARLVSRVREAFRVEVPLRAVFEAPTVAGLAERVDAALRAGAGEGAPPLLPVPRDGRPLPLSFAQQRLWFLHRLEPGSPAYNIPYALRLRGPLDPAAFRAALGGVVRRHESLRTVFGTEHGEPVQTVLPPRPCRSRSSTSAASPPPRARPRCGAWPARRRPAPSTWRADPCCARAWRGWARRSGRSS